MDRFLEATGVLKALYTEHRSGIASAQLDPVRSAFDERSWQTLIARIALLLDGFSVASGSAIWAGAHPAARDLLVREPRLEGILEVAQGALRVKRDLTTQECKRLIGLRDEWAAETPLLARPRYSGGYRPLLHEVLEGVETLDPADHPELVKELLDEGGGLEE